MFEKMIDELPREVPLSITRIHSDKKRLAPVWVVQIGNSTKESHADLLMAFQKAVEKWKNQ